ncbi:ferritin-like domain-containing protein [Rhodospirillaceae bacterium SYSU D60014]|uniref:DUF2383 domain-containing protein n=1 Tax=Virgifigura deserti TaxID=2268457 RepID=UPI000E6692E3
MVTTVGTETDFIDMLNNLIRLDFDAIDAYEAAVDRLERRSDAEQLRAFQADHERHTREVAAIVRDLGGTPATAGDAKSMLTTGKVLLADLIGDKAVLRAMKTNEDDTNTAYERAVRHGSKTPAANEVLQRNLCDERRHRSWIEEAINRL